MTATAIYDHFAAFLSGNSNSALTGTLSRFAICSIVSNDGALIPRSIRLKKSTEMPINSANSSWVSLRSWRIAESL